MKTLLILLMGIFLSNNSIAQSCQSVIGESQGGAASIYNDLSKTCKLRLTDGRCIRLQATVECPENSVQVLNEAQSAAALKEYAAKQKATIDGYNNLAKRSREIEECNRFSQVRFSCASAGNYEQCMTIRFGDSYRAMPQKCK